MYTTSKHYYLLGTIEKADETPFFFDMLRQQFMHRIKISTCQNNKAWKTEKNCGAFSSGWWELTDLICSSEEKRSSATEIPVSENIFKCYEKVWKTNSWSKGSKKYGTEDHMLTKKMEEYWFLMLTWVT